MTESEMQCTLNLQLEVYVSGSTSFKVVEGRARAALSFFVDIKVLSCELHALNEWFVLGLGAIESRVRVQDGWPTGNPCAEVRGTFNVREDVP